MTSSAIFGALPSVARFLESIATGLAEGCQTVVLLPCRVPKSVLLEGLSDACHRRSLEVAVAHVGKEQQISIPDLLSEYGFCLERQAGMRTWSGSERSPDVLLIESAPLSEAWSQDIAQLAADVRSKTGRRGPTICIATELNDNAILPVPDVNLLVRWWWGVPAASELRVLAHELLKDHGSSEAQRRWTSGVVCALAKGDPEFLLCLCATPPSSLAEALDSLTELARTSGWTGESLGTAGAFGVGLPPKLWARDASEMPRPPLRRLWGSGAVVNLRDEGLRLHSGALVAIGRQYEVLHRIWTEQLLLLSGWVDAIRLGLCEMLTEAHGAGWADRWLSPVLFDDYEREYIRKYGDYGAELRQLKRISERASPLQLAPWKSLLETAKNLRNELAHGKPVELSAVLTLQLRADQAYAVAVPVRQRSGAPETNGTPRAWNAADAARPGRPIPL